LKELWILCILTRDLKRIPEIPSFLHVIAQVDAWVLFTVATIPK